METDPSLLSLSPFLSFSFAWQQTKQAVHLSFDRHSSSSSLSSSRSSFSRSPRFLRASPRTTMTGEKGDTISRAGERKRERRKCAFAEMNAIVAQTLSHLTSSLRYEGSLNVDLEDICTNLVPFPGLHFLLASLPSSAQPREETSLARAFSQSFNALLSPAHQLFACHPKRSLCLAAAFLVRGAGISVSDLLNNIGRVRRSLRVLSGNEDATKIGLCAVAPVGQTYGLLGLSNSCEATHLFSSVHERFDKLFKRKAHLHHYEQYMDLDMFVEASESVLDLASSYAFLNRNNFPPPAFLGADLHAF